MFQEINRQQSEDSLMTTIKTETEESNRKIIYVGCFVALDFDEPLNRF